MTSSGKRSSDPSGKPAGESSPSSPNLSWTPRPIRILFSKFPLQTLPPDTLPSNTLSTSSRQKHTLFLFTTASVDDKDAAYTPSFNPTCLKWQTYLLIKRIHFNTWPSSNHASPSGSLPFLISGTSSRQTVTSSKEKGKGETITTANIQSWIDRQPNSTSSEAQGHEKEAEASEEEDSSDCLRDTAFLSLIDHRIRPAWLHAFYLTSNLNSLAAPLYIHSQTSSIAVRTWQTSQLRAAALAEVVKTSPKVDAEIMYKGAREAFAALETALGREEWFSGRSEPGLLDAAVFGYVGLILDDQLGAEVGATWTDRKLREIVMQFDRLARHRQRVLERYFSPGG